MEAAYTQTLKDRNSESSLWFKFSDDDTLVTTIDDLERDLSNSNRDFTLERIKEVINLDQELFIHYSWILDLSVGTVQGVKNQW